MQEQQQQQQGGNRGAVARKESCYRPARVQVTAIEHGGAGSVGFPAPYYWLLLGQLCNVRTTLGTLSENAQIQIMEVDLNLVPLTTARRAV